MEWMSEWVSLLSNALHYHTNDQIEFIKKKKNNTAKCLHFYNCSNVIWANAFDQTIFYYFVYNHAKAFSLFGCVTRQTVSPLSFSRRIRSAVGYMLQLPACVQTKQTFCGFVSFRIIVCLSYFADGYCLQRTTTERSGRKKRKLTREINHIAIEQRQ